MLEIEYWVLKCYYDSEELQSEFTQNFNMQIGDYIATCLFKGQIPIENRNIRLPTPFRNEEMPKSKVVIHAGKHWKTKTFPKHWWDKIVKGLVANKIQPALIGATVDKGKRGYVELESDGCLDYRDKLSVMQSVSLLRQADVVITNDSAPFHMAASGDAWIGYFSTVRHHDFTSHWRPNENGVNQWSYKIEDLALGTMWKDNDINPVTNGVKYDDIDTPTLISWLPEPEDVVDWAMEKLGSH